MPESLSRARVDAPGVHRDRRPTCWKHPRCPQGPITRRTMVLMPPRGAAMPVACVAATSIFLACPRCGSTSRISRTMRGSRRVAWRNGARRGCRKIQVRPRRDHAAGWHGRLRGDGAARTGCRGRSREECRQHALDMPFRVATGSTAAGRSDAATANPATHGRNSGTGAAPLRDSGAAWHQGVQASMRMLRSAKPFGAPAVVLLSEVCL